jgi:hypothetical protein
MPVGGSDAPPGTSHPERWKPYKLWNSDMWECEGCGTQIVVGHGHSPISEHYMPDFAERVATFHAELQVNDC